MPRRNRRGGAEVEIARLREENDELRARLKRRDSAPTAAACPECRSPKVATLELAGRRYLVCRECRWRARA